MDAEKRSRPEKIQVARKGHVHGKGHNHSEMAQKKENSRRRGETGKQAAWLDWRGQRGVRLIAPQIFDFEKFPARAAKKF